MSAAVRVSVLSPRVLPPRRSGRPRGAYWSRELSSESRCPEDPGSSGFDRSLLRTARKMTTDRTIIRMAKALSVPVSSPSSRTLITCFPQRVAYTYHFVWSADRDSADGVHPVSGRARSSLGRPSGMANSFMSPVPWPSMDDIDPDTAMIAAGIVLSLIAVLEIYSAFKNARER